MNSFKSRKLVILLYIFIVWQTACSVHVRNIKKGQEYLIGIGALHKKVDELSPEILAVRASAIKPGISLGIGNGLTGISFGLKTDEYVVIYPKHGVETLEELNKVSYQWLKPFKKFQFPISEHTTQMSALEARQNIGLDLNFNQSYKGVTLGYVRKSKTIIYPSDYLISILNTNRIDQAYHSTIIIQRIFPTNEN